MINQPLLKKEKHSINELPSLQFSRCILCLSSNAGKWNPEAALPLPQTPYREGKQNLINKTSSEGFPKALQQSISIPTVNFTVFPNSASALPFHNQEEGINKGPLSLGAK